jgi:hypothetical protein
MPHFCFVPFRNFLDFLRKMLFRFRRESGKIITSVCHTGTRVKCHTNEIKIAPLQDQKMDLLEHTTFF